MTKYTLGFDIGTKNLAYCLSKYENKHETPENSKINISNIGIIDWNIIDIHRTNLKCTQIKNKRAVCNKKCFDYILNNDTNTIEDHYDINNINGYCKTHVKQLRVSQQKLAKDKKLQLKYKTKTNSNIVVNNTTEHKTHKIYKVKNNKLFNDNINASTEKLLVKLEELFLKISRPYDYNIETKKLSKIKKLSVIIENQPTTRQSMNNISMIIYTYFQIKKITHPNLVEKVRFINGKTKTSKDFVTDIYHTFSIKSSITKFIEYRNRKDYSEDIVKKLLFKIKQNDKLTLNKMIPFFMRTKKDDLADALLFCIHEYFYNM